MGEKCNPTYKNLNTIQSYSEQKYATVQWCEQNCANDEWLRQQVELLRYLSPPAVRKNFDITQFLDEKKSYSCRGNGEKQVIFDNTTRKTVVIDFRDIPNQIDEANTTARIVNDNPQATTTETTDDETLNFDSESNVVDDEENTQLLRCRLPSTVDTHEVDAEVKTFGTATPTTKLNSYWYVGWDKDKNYYISPNWLKQWKHCDIKSVARAQTFVAKYTGELEEISLALAWNGNQSASCGSPLYVQLWNTYKDYVPKSTWDNSKKQMVYNYKKYENLTADKRSIYANRKRYSPYKVKKKYTSGKNKGQVVKKKKNGKWVTLTETKWKEDKNGAYVRELTKVYRPGHNKKGTNGYKSNIYNPLAEAEYTKVGEPFPTIKFKSPYTIKKGNHYAIVVFSPLSMWSHCPRWGGWGRNCKNDNAYSDGHAFISKNNGRNWSIYGKDGTDTLKSTGKAISYTKGKFTPQDFAFQCHVQTKKAETVDDGVRYSEKPHYLYLKPIYCNPITSVKLSAECEGTERTDNRTFIDFEVSIDGVEWIPIDNLGTVEFTPDEYGNYSQMLLVRATLYRNADESYKSETPFIEKIELDITSTLPKTMYARTSFYKPVMTPMLKGNLWGRLYAPFKVDDTVTCKAEIIQGSDIVEHFKIISQDNLDETLYELLHDDNEDNDSIMNDLAETQSSISEILSKTGDERANSLTTNYKVLEVLKNYNIYIKPHLSTDGLKLYLLSFSASNSTNDMISTRTSVHGATSNATFNSSDEENDDAETKLDSPSDILYSAEDNTFDFKIGGVKFNDNVAYPILSFNGQPSAQEKGASVDSYTEGVDYTFDYENNILYLKRHTLDALMEETWEVTYNKIFVDNLTSEELGKYLDETTGLRDDGFVLDYHKEKIVVNSDHITSRRVKLRMEPTDPIRQVILYRKDNVTGDYEEGVELFEDTDFTFVIDTKELDFTIKTSDGVSTVLSLGDVLEIVYTPYLTDDSLAIGYYATRTNTDKQCYIDNVYFEYKV